VNKPTVNELAEIIELRYPKSLAVEWDVVGFATNNSNIEVNNILLTIDVTEGVVAEAIEKSVDLIISHHPLILDPNEISDIQTKRIQLRQKLEENNIACRPLISGSMGTQPFYKKIYGENKLPNCSIIDDRGVYVPNHDKMTVEDINRICDILLKY